MKRSLLLEPFGEQLTCIERLRSQNLASGYSKRKHQATGNQKQYALAAVAAAAAVKQNQAMYSFNELQRYVNPGQNGYSGQNGQNGHLRKLPLMYLNMDYMSALMAGQEQASGQAYYKTGQEKTGYPQGMNQSYGGYQGSLGQNYRNYQNAPTSQGQAQNNQTQGNYLAFGSQGNAGEYNTGYSGNGHGNGMNNTNSIYNIDENTGMFSSNIFNMAPSLSQDTASVLSSSSRGFDNMSTHSLQTNQSSSTQSVFTTRALPPTTGREYGYSESPGSSSESELPLNGGKPASSGLESSLLRSIWMPPQLSDSGCAISLSNSTKW